jgi:microcystin-dependent protein
MEDFLGTIRMFGFNFAPVGYQFCQGQLMSIAQNSALFSLLGTIYGGDGMQTFALPDLRGKVPVGQGTGPGLTPRQIGQVVGTESTALTIANLPPHNHPITGTVSIPCNPDSADSDSPEGTCLAAGGSSIYSNSATAAMMPATVNLTVGVAGSGVPVTNMQPSLVINYCICTEGIYPSRS